MSESIEKVDEPVTNASIDDVDNSSPIPDNNNKSSFSVEKSNESDVNDNNNNNTKINASIIDAENKHPFILTDMKIGTILLFIASLWYLINTGITAANRFPNLIQSQAKVTQITIDFITSIFNLIAVMLLMHLSWFDGWKAIYVQLENFDSSKEWFWTKYFCGNKLMVAMWLFWLPNIICFWFAAWALYEFNTSGIPVSVYNYSSTIVAELAGSLITCWLSFYWVYSTFPELMRKNKTYGSVTFGYYLTVIGAIYLGVSGWSSSDQNQFEPPPEFGLTKNKIVSDGDKEKSATENAETSSQSKSCLQTFASDCLNPMEATGKYFQRPLFGSDFSAGTFIFFLASFIGILLSAIEYVNYQPSRQYAIGLAVTSIYFVGSIFVYVGSYPSHMRQHDHVGSTVFRDFFLWLGRGCRSQPQYEIITPVAAGGDENAKF